MGQIIWSPIAFEDLNGIYDYIAKDSPRYARMVVRDIVAMVKSMRRFPLAGRIVPEYNRIEIRERIYKSYRIIYHLQDDDIEIIAVHHSARILNIEI